MWPRSFLCLLLLTSPLLSAPPPKDPNAKPNRLAKESSPYLLQHAYNPVDWFPWGDEAFAKAKKEGKMIFLSIGYSSCHWCHVMERESFANPAVAKIMNENFVCIKLDREERPDVDQVYMTAINVLGQRGGWPLSMFLTPEGKPIFGGTYWPPEDKEFDGEKVLGFKSVMNAGLTLWRDKKKELEAQADKVAEATVTALTRGRGFALANLDRELVTETVAALKEQADPVYGGFGNREAKFRGTKFPTPPYLELLAYEVNRGDQPELAAMLGRTLDHMAQGGIYDQLGGGFHRYSTERTWTAPHFEKMLYDNAQLLETYADAYRRTKKPLYRQTLADTIAFLRREMTDPQGGFYSALDADSEEEEGRFYVWTPAELDAALPAAADRDLIKKVFSADEGPNFEGKYHILVRNRPLKEAAASLKLTEAELEAKLTPLMRRLFEIRAKRERPFLDIKVLTAWNGQMIAGLAKAGMVLEDKTAIAAADKAADFLLANLAGKDGRLLRTWSARPGEKPIAKLNGYLDDYAFLVHGLLNLHDATGDKRRLDQARMLTDKMIEHHHDKERGGFFFTSHDHEKLFARAKDQYDGAQPSGNSVAARNLVRLWTKTGEARYRDLAEATLKAFVSNLKNNPTGATTMAQALGMFLDAQEKK